MKREGRYSGAGRVLVIREKGGVLTAEFIMYPTEKEGEAAAASPRDEGLKG